MKQMQMDEQKFEDLKELVNALATQKIIENELVGEISAYKLSEIITEGSEAEAAFKKFIEDKLISQLLKQRETGTTQITIVRDTVDLTETIRGLAALIGIPDPTQTVAAASGAAAGPSTETPGGQAVVLSGASNPRSDRPNDDQTPGGPDSVVMDIDDAGDVSPTASGTEAGLIGQATKHVGPVERKRDLEVVGAVFPNVQEPRQSVTPDAPNGAAAAADAQSLTPGEPAESGAAIPEKRTSGEFHDEVTKYPGPTERSREVEIVVDSKPRGQGSDATDTTMNPGLRRDNFLFSSRRVIQPNDGERQEMSVGNADNAGDPGESLLASTSRASLNVFLGLLCIRALMPAAAFVIGYGEVESQGENHNHETAASMSALAAGGLNIVLGWGLTLAQNKWWQTQKSTVDKAYARGENRYGPIKAVVVGLSTAIAANIGLHHFIAGISGEVTPVAAGLANVASACLLLKLAGFMVKSSTLNPVKAVKENARPEKEFQRPGCCSR